MRKLLSLILFIVAFALSAQVKPGIETLAERGFEPLRGKRVGLITNPTGVDRQLRSTVDILAAAPGVKLTALFAPEHGVRGDRRAGEKIKDEVDAATGVKVYSLHGSTQKPTKEMLADVDVLVYDIQDIGCRSYTFISTMGLAMEAAAEFGKEFVVLDRPNPLGGEKVEGNLTEKGLTSFVAQYPIPYIYGLTPGELAAMLNGEKMLAGGRKCALTVVPMQGWTRSMLYADTQLPWVLPSPHIPWAETALLYPATGIMGELAYISIGVGYTLPFGTAAAPWIDRAKLCARLRGLNIPGVEFRPIVYTPFYAQMKGESLSGVQIFVTDFEAAPLTLVQFYIMQTLAELYPDHLPFASSSAASLKMFDKVCGSRRLRTQFAKRFKVADILPEWTSETAKFKKKSSRYYLYK